MCHSCRPNVANHVAGHAAGAEHVVRAGAAVLLPESELTPVSLAALLRELLEAGRPRLMAMAEAARRTAIIDADERLADACIAAAGMAA